MVASTNCTPFLRPTMKNLHALATVAILLSFAMSANANQVDIDDLTSSTGAKQEVFTDGTYSVYRTITTNTLSHNGNAFSDITSSSGIIFTAVYEVDNGIDQGTFGDVWAAAFPELANIGYSANGIQFGYSTFTGSALPGLAAEYTATVSSDTSFSQQQNVPFGGGQFRIATTQGNAGIDDARVLTIEFASANTNTGFFSFQNNFSVTPEPSAAFLFGSVVLGTVLRRRRA